MTSAFFEEKGFFIFWRKNPFIGKQEWLEAEKYQKISVFFHGWLVK